MPTKSVTSSKLTTSTSSSGPPVSLEAERRRTMTIVHKVEKDITAFKDKYFKRMKLTVPEDIHEFVHFVTDRNQVKRYPKNSDDFLNLLSKIRDAAEVAFKKEMDIVEEAIELYSAYKAAIQSITDRLREALEDHVGKYCHSFSAEAGCNDIPAVQMYENNITRWRGQIKEAFCLLGDILRNIKEAAMNFELFLTNFTRVAHYMTVSFEVFPKIYNPMKDWVTSDEAYVRRLQDDMCELKQEKMTIDGIARRQKMHAGGIQSKVTRSQHHSKNLSEKLSRARDERRVCRKRELSFIEVSSKIADQLNKKTAVLDKTLQSLYRKDHQPSTSRSHLMETSTTLSDEINRLEKKMSVLKMEMRNVKKQRIEAQKELHKIQVLCEKNSKLELDIQDDAEDATQDVRDLEEERRILGEKVIALARIRAIKLHPNTVKVIYSEGYTPGRKFDVADALEEACQIAASEVGRDWPPVNQKLMTSPRRDSPRRDSPHRESPRREARLPDLSARSDPGPRPTRSLLKKGTQFRGDKWSKVTQEASINALERTLRTQQRLAEDNGFDKVVTVN